MGRTRSSERTSNKKSAKDTSFNMFNKHDKFPSEGWYIGIPTKIKSEESYLKVSAKILSLDRLHDYGEINGFLPISYSDEDVTAEFMEVFDNPHNFSDVIGKEVKVYVEFNESENGKEYANMVGYEKL